MEACSRPRLCMMRVKRCPTVECGILFPASFVNTRSRDCSIPALLSACVQAVAGAPAFRASITAGATLKVRALPFLVGPSLRSVPLPRFTKQLRVYLDGLLLPVYPRPAQAQNLRQAHARIQGDIKHRLRGIAFDGLHELRDFFALQGPYFRLGAFLQTQPDAGL